jgi:hypothetical protein
MTGIKYLCRSRAMSDALHRVGSSIALDAGDMAARQGDNSPRHYHQYSKNAGAGYAHYDQAIEVIRGMDLGMAAVYVMAERHAIWLEFGWTPKKPDGTRGTHKPARHYLTNALWLNKEDA